MSATVFYDDVNEIAQSSNTFSLNGSPADPTAVLFVVTDPSGNQVTHTYLGASPADITRSGTGIYGLAVVCSPSITNVDGLWSGVWIGTGAVSDVQPVTWRVFPEQVNLWYCGLEELKSRLSITDSKDDFEATLAIQTACTWINDTCGQHFYRITETRTFIPDNILEVTIDPLVSITSLAVDTTGDGVYDQSWVLNTDYQLKLAKDKYNLNALGIKRPYKQVQSLQAGKWFPPIYPYAHWDRVQIVGTWGWFSVPPPIAEVSLVLAAEWFKAKDAPFGVAGINDFGPIRIQTNPWTMQKLRPYINAKTAVGV